MEVIEVEAVSGFNVGSFDIAESTGEIVAVLHQTWPSVYVGSIHWPGPRLDDVNRVSLDAVIAYPHGWTPDSGGILYESRLGGHFQVYEQRLDRHDPQPIVATRESQSAPRMSPDHNWILFESRVAFDAPDLLFRVSPHGGVPEPLSTGGRLVDFRCPALGKTCVIRTLDDQRHVLYSALDPNNGRCAPLYRPAPAQSDLTDWDVSPDGSTLVLISRDSAPQLETVLLSSGHLVEVPIGIADRIIGVNWAADQKGWFVAASTGAASDLFYANPQGRPTFLRRVIGPTWGVPSPDDRKLAFVDENVDSNVWLMQPTKTATRSSANDLGTCAESGDRRIKISGALRGFLDRAYSRWNNKDWA